MFNVEKITDERRFFVDAQIANDWAGPYVVTKGVRHDTRTHPGFVAVESGEVIGYILYHMTGDECEITVLESLSEGRGVGSALIKEVIYTTEAKKCRRVWLITTNDNTAAIRFYQRFGFELRAVYINAIEVSRKLKPQIPQTGFDEIPIKHELEFEYIVGD